MMASIRAKPFISGIGTRKRQRLISKPAAATTPPEN